MVVNSRNWGSFCKTVKAAGGGAEGVPRGGL
jgi:hypothetical protein